jgi:hypothetical protein
MKKTSNYEQGRVLNTGREASKSQQQKLNLTLKHKSKSSKGSVKYPTNNWI